MTDPFPGPQPFTASDADRDRFFGREYETSILVSLVFSQPVVLLYAQSGAGKTSLWNAGVTPALRDEGFEVLRAARVGGDLPSGIDEVQLENSYMFRALLTLAPDAPPAPKQTLEQFLAGRPRAHGKLGPVPRVVAFDHVEELFVLGSDRSLADQEGFFSQMARAIGADPRLRVVLLLREDFLAPLLTFAELVPGHLEAGFRLERLDGETALDAVVKPVRQAGRDFEPGAAEALISELRTVTAPTPSGGTRAVVGEYVEPVQLQAVCSSLWSSLQEDQEVITRADIELFDVDRALTELYTAAIEAAIGSGLVDEAQVRDWFDRQLITPMRTRGLVMQDAHETGTLPNAVVTILEERYLIRPEPRGGARWYELAHDRLIEPISKSNAAWRDVIGNDLAMRAREWQRLGRDRGSLLRGKRLKEVEAWATDREQLGQLERDFLRRSVTAREVERLAKLASTLAPAVPLILALTAVGFLFPSVEAVAGGADTGNLFEGQWRPSAELVLLMWVASAAAVGAFAKATNEFVAATRDPNRTFSWAFSYALQAIVGIALAVVFYFVLRAGLYSAKADASTVNPYGLGALAGLVGLFSRQAAEKLRLVFDTAFRARDEPLPEEPAPRLDSAALDSTGTLELRGTGFVPESAAAVDAFGRGVGPYRARATDYFGPNQLRATLLPTDVAEPRTLFVRIVNPPPHAAVSAPLAVEIPAPIASPAAREPEGPELIA